MSTRASFRGHPLHPVIVDLPIGLWIFSVVADVVYLLGWGSGVWEDVALYTMGGGIVGALVAMLPGLLDWLSLSDPKVKAVATWHMIVNIAVTLLFAANFWWRLHGGAGVRPFVLSVIAVALLGLAGYLGGELVFVHGVGTKARE